MTGRCSCGLLVCDHRIGTVQLSCADLLQRRGEFRLPEPYHGTGHQHALHQQVETTRHRIARALDQRSPR